MTGSTVAEVSQGAVQVSVSGVDQCDRLQWDSYIDGHEHSSPYHTWSFCKAVADTYRPESFLLTARRDGQERITGVLPLFYVKSLLMTNSLVSLPYCDYGGVLADDSESSAALLARARHLATSMNVPLLELRQTYPLFEERVGSSVLGPHVHCAKEKVRMSLRLGGDPDEFFKQIPAKLRAQIRRPTKEGCVAESGGLELLDDFYEVFLYNMRTLGSPVHSKRLIRNVVEQFGDNSRLFVVYAPDKKPVACAAILIQGARVVNPWASSDRRYQRMAPNMLLYWSMISYAMSDGHKFFDFGRSTEGEGTYRFKQQWGATPEQLWWYTSHRDPIRATPDGSSVSESKARFIAVWQRLPLGITRVVGPLLRKGISL